ncbi:COX15/CtaA family protein [Clavibacter michiganensis]|nr:COX15/CtaA family protein [Clavibacter michiganensis]
MTHGTDAGQSPSGSVLGQTLMVGRRLRERLPDGITRVTRILVWTTLAVQTLVVGTGGLVRLTGSGLGCPTWPRCTADSFVSTPEMGVHGLIEFGNRLLTFVLVIVAIATFLAVLRLRNRGRGLFSIALAIGLGIPAQGVIGGITVLTGLNPYIVGLHFVVSVVLVVLSTVLVWRTYHPFDEAERSVPSSFSTLARVTAVAVGVTILVGIVVTGSGPHAGDQGAARNGLDPELLQHIHSWPAYATFGLTIALVAIAARNRWTAVSRWTRVLLAVEVAQIAVGIIQARTGLPEFLVGLHMVLACLLASAMTATLLSTTRRADTLRLTPAEVRRSAHVG